MPGEFETVIFDCDGVLVDSEVLAIRGERAVLQEMGLNYTPEDYVRRFVGLHDRAFFEMLREDYTLKWSLPAPSDFAERLLEGRGREKHSLRMIDGADLALVAAAKAGGAGVASSSAAAFLESKLRRTGLWDYVAPHVYSADLVNNGKPSPDIFLYAAEKLGAAPATCLVVEDSENGVRAGVAAGMTVCGFTGGGHCFDGHGERLTAAGASWIARDFAEFLGALVP